MSVRSKPALFIDHLRVAYRNDGRLCPVLQDVSFKLEKGEILVMVGESGAGKSTVARAITGLLPPSAHVTGSMQIDATALELGNRRVPWERIRGKQIAMLFQDARQALNPVMKIRHHFAETFAVHRIAPAGQVDGLCEDMLSALRLDDVRRVLNSYPFQLSGGMCQKVCLALAACLRPSVLIADEPTSALDDDSRRQLLAMLDRLRQDYGLSVLFITHDLTAAEAIGDRAIALHRGEITDEGRVRTVVRSIRPKLAVRPFSLRPPLTETILEIRSLEKRYKPGCPVLRGVHLTIGAGEIVGLCGPSGCGKSTLARCVMGLEAPTRGSVLFRGTDIVGLRGKQRRMLSRHIQMVFQDARGSLHPGRTALELVQQPLHDLKIRPKRDRTAFAADILEQVGIRGELMLRKPPQLSTGQCQRVAIARALVVRPDVLICDEAVSSLDTAIQAQVLDLLERLHRQYRFAILMISHDLSMLRSFCHRILAMKEGRVVEVGDNLPSVAPSSRYAGDAESGGMS